MAALSDRSVSARRVLSSGSAVLVHDRPGRLRLVLPALKGGGSGADEPCVVLQLRQAVRDVAVRAVRFTVDHAMQGAIAAIV